MTWQYLETLVREPECKKRALQTTILENGLASLELFHGRNEVYNVVLLVTW